jgi:hypothetical protein
MSEVEVAWVAGLVEGEGCFYIQTEKYTSKRTGETYHNRRPTLIVAMTDEDVVKRLQEVTGVGTVNRSGPQNKNRPNHKPMWRYRVNPVATLMLAIRLYPYMGRRRREKIEDLLGEFTVDNPSTRRIVTEAAT